MSPYQLRLATTPPTRVGQVSGAFQLPQPSNTDGDAALMQPIFGTGLDVRRENNDVAGIGISFGKPADGALRDQFTSEAFYRFQVTQFHAITPRRPIDR